MTKLTLKEFISELNARLEKFSYDELTEILRLVSRFKGKYNRHSAFKAKLQKAAKNQSPFWYPKRSSREMINVRKTNP